MTGIAVGAAINLIFLWACLLPIAIIGVILLIKLLSRNKNNFYQQHNYKTDHDYSAMKQENRMIYLGKSKYGSSKYRIEQDAVCKHCDDKITYEYEEHYSK